MNKSITTLNLRFNRIGVEGAKALAEFLKVNENITTLNLGDNAIEVEGVKALVEGLKVNKSITTVNLRGNNIGDDGVKALVEALEVNENITTLDLRDNKIRDEGGTFLAKTLLWNRHLTKLSLSGNWISNNVNKLILKSAAFIHPRLITVQTQLDNEKSENLPGLCRQRFQWKQHVLSFREKVFECLRVARRLLRMWGRAKTKMSECPPDNRLDVLSFLVGNGLPPKIVNGILAYASDPKRLPANNKEKREAFIREILGEKYTITGVVYSGGNEVSLTPKRLVGSKS